MSINKDLKEFEQKLKSKSFMHFNADGILDIIIGWDILFIGIFLYTHSFAYMIPGLLPLFFILSLKKWITLPRLGHASFRTRRTISMKVVGALGAVLLLAAIIFGFASNNLVGSIALVLIGIAFLLFLQTGFNRAFAYGLLVPIFFIAGLGSGLLSPPIIMGTGAVLFLMGIWMLIQFLKTNPIIEAGEIYGEE